MLQVCRLILNHSMASSSVSASVPESSQAPSLKCYQSAIAIIPPAYLHPQINALRSLYDKAYGKWPAHINVLYPFVEHSELSEAVTILKNVIERESYGGFEIHLDREGVFQHRQNATVFLSPGSHEENSSSDLTEQELEIRRLHTLLDGQFRSGNNGAKGRDGDGVWRPHLTVGQTSLDTTSMDYLLSKAGRLADSPGGIKWHVGKLAVLKRRSDGKMEVIDEIPLVGKVSYSRFDIDLESGSEEEGVEKSRKLDIVPELEAHGAAAMTGRNSFQFSPATEDWLPNSIFDSEESIPLTPKEITISTYNTLIDAPIPPPTSRYPLLLNSILSIHATTPGDASPSILCLQEVTDEFLVYLLSRSEIQQRYPFCTHSPTDVLPSIRNSIILATAACGAFEWSWLGFAKRHKGAVIATFPGLHIDGKSMAVATVHLTSGLTNGSLAAKVNQLKSLTETLQRDYSSNEWVVAGDFNIPSSKKTIATARGIGPEMHSMLRRGLVDTDVFVDAWEAVYTEHEEDILSLEYLTETEGTGAMRHEGEWGATFDPITNPLAAKCVKWGGDPRPQRYDRILFRRFGRIGVRDVRRFGFPSKGKEELCGSDHWGLKAVLNIREASKNTEAEGEIVELKLEAGVVEDVNLWEIVESTLSLPTSDQNRLREAAIEKLQTVLESSNIPTNSEIETLQPSRSSFPLILAPIGSYAIKVHDNSSDLDILCVSTISSKIFFTLALQRIQKDDNIRLRRFVDAQVPILHIKINDLNVDLQYCQSLTMVESWPSIRYRRPEDPLFGLPATTLKAVNAYRDAEYLMRTIPNLKPFRLAHRIIKLWAKNCGIFSAKLGYLGGFHITLMLARVCKLAEYQIIGSFKELSAAEIVRAFFRYYSKFDWEREAVEDPEFRGSIRPYQRSVREPMVILTINTPVKNVAENATKHSLRTLDQEFQHAEEAMERGGRWELELLGRMDANSADERFLNTFGSFVKIDVRFWGGSRSKGRALMGWVESRCPLLLVELIDIPEMNKKVPSIYARIWPSRFTTAELASDLFISHGFYLVGLVNKDLKPDGRNPEINPSTAKSAESATAPQEFKVRKSEIENKFLDVLRTFESQLQSNKQFDLEYSLISVQHVNRSSFSEDGSIQLDTEDWGDDEDEDDCIDGIKRSLGEMGFKIEKEAFGSAEEIEIVSASPHKKPVNVKRTPGQKLRPAHDVMNRIRWDSGYDIGDYIVGYEDRFLGRKEMALEKWKMEQTEMDFVPMHRVVYFKRKSDGVFVWDRDGRRDLVFGSGEVDE
ncbi:hypothetical protein RUND412_006673 [Rhizina undulata]